MILETTKRFIEEINASNSTTDKKEVLKKFPEMKEMLEAVYNPFKMYYVSSDNCKKNSDLQTIDTHGSIFNLLEDLRNRKITGHDAISAVNNFVRANKDYKDIIYKILDKDLECRIGDKVINDVYPGLIPTFEVTLCNKYEDVKDKIDLIKENYYSSHKLDGCLSGETLVELQNKGICKLKDVVENQISDKIKCYNHKLKKIVYENIIGYGKNIDINEKNNNWFLITLEDGTKIKATANHLFFIKELDAYRRLDELKEGDYLLLSK